MAITLTITDLESLSAKQRKTVTQFIEDVAGDDTCSGSGKCHDHGNAVAAPENWGQSRTEIINKAHGFNAEELSELFVLPENATKRGELAARAAFGPKSNATSTVAVEAPMIAPEVAPVTTTTNVIPAPVQQTASVVPAQTEPAAPSNLVNGVEVDSSGLPWDIRIHASNKARAKAGTWVRKRNVDDAEFTRIEAQLRHALNAPALPPVVQSIPLPPAIPALPPVAEAPVVSVPMATLQPLVQQIPAIPLPPAIPALPPVVEVPVPPVVAPATSMSFLQLVTAVPPGGGFRESSVDLLRRWYS